MFNPSRDQVRLFFCEAWRKHRDRLPLVGAELAAADIVGRHPEYQSLLADPDAAVQGEWTPDSGGMNPFLHLSLHLAIHEQVSIDQPPGIRAAFETLRARLDPHAAEHVVLEALGETIWRSQREGRPMDAAAYLEALRRAATAS
ncbi:MAG TPA: DUF1841 family protein [Rhodocyclaceae bacterium]|jgi:hypothetical protein|nr:DUF1841 family protein [Rhodocyclaceae bacterium]HMW78144.1 DUF1841 family protein [Rhodocyclaceae bacterium]HNE42129.1 DUF1841 family protein [Rhodocyclaceae bacterium]HNL20543.1 DUF1841 family protein [Rhodocyclaceae bacterium]HNM23348.1 DUF1841 family protein [Rhodocyclaceae bacterium]